MYCNLSTINEDNGKSGKHKQPRGQDYDTFLKTLFGGDKSGEKKV